VHLAPSFAAAQLGAVHLNAEVTMRIWYVITTILLASAVPAGAQFVAPGGAIPAVASLPGENETFWRSDVNILNPNSAATSVVLVLYPEIRMNGPVFDIQQSDPIDIDGNGQITLYNVVTSVFGERNKKGALYVFSTDGSPIVLGSRTYTPAPNPPGGSYGLNVSGILVADTAWVAGIEDDGFFRTSVGVFVPAGPSVGQQISFTVTIFDDSGLEVASGPLSFDQAGMQQKDMDFFGLDDPLLNGWVEKRVFSLVFLVLRSPALPAS
jgi:hypothetical protein